MEIYRISMKKWFSVIFREFKYFRVWHPEKPPPETMVLTAVFMVWRAAAPKNPF